MQGRKCPICPTWRRDRMRSLVKPTQILLIASALSLAACGGDNEGSGSLIPSNGGGSGNTPGGETGGGGEAVAQLALGTGEGSSFQAGAIELGSPSVSANGQVSVSVNVVNQAADNALYTAAPVSIRFTSNCAEQNLAALSSSVSTSTGKAQTTYTAKGCSGSDTITAVIGDNEAIAIGNIIVASAEGGHIAPVSATPTSLALKGFGTSTLPTVSDITFQVTDKAGNPAPAGTKVSFAPDRATGDITLSNSTATTDSNGLVSTRLSAGSVKTTVRVIAWLEENPDIRAMSTTIALGTGAPTQQSMSLSIDTFNPRALNYDGEETSITIRVSDYYNNPIADGTTIAFYTSGGQIDRECVYSEALGGCSVTWRSQAPRPANGVVAVMATLKGEEETGPDLNGNGLFDGSPSETYKPLPEAFLDANQNNKHDPNEFFLDWDLSGTYSEQPAPMFRGIRCSDAAMAAPQNHCRSAADREKYTELADIFKNAWFVMAGEVEPTGIRLLDASNTELPEWAILDQNQTYRVIIQDPNGHSAPNGTSVSITIDDGDDEIIGGNVSHTVPPTTARPYTKDISFKPEMGLSILKIEVTNVGGEKVEKFLRIN